MNENLVENYKEEQPDFQQDVSFSRGQRDVTTNEEVEYEFDFEECPEDNDNDENEENDQYENKNEHKNNEGDKFRRVHFSLTNEIILIDRPPDQAKG